MPTLTSHTPYTASKVALLSMQNDFKLHGLPRSIVSERDSSILPSLELFKLQGAVIAMSTAYPQTDGQTEIINKGLEDYLRCYAGKHPKQWSTWLPFSEFWYNTNFHASTEANLWMHT